MKKKNIWTKIGLGILGAVLSIVVIAAGVSLGNKGLKNALDETKEKLKDALDDDKKSTSSEVATAHGTYVINYVE